MRKNLLIFSAIFWLLSCAADSKHGSAVGYVTSFEREGVFWKSWDIQLNVSQTGMTSTEKEQEFSIDNDHENPAVVALLDSAQRLAWKVRIDYRQSFGTNCCGNRGSNNTFITNVDVLDRMPITLPVNLR